MVVVALVQADAGFVEHVEHAGEAGADLAGEADALALAAGQRAGGAVEVEIIEPDIVEEAQPLVDFLEDGLGDLASAGWSACSASPGTRRARRRPNAACDRDVVARDLDR
jgi:hypothetical protein